MTPKEKAQELYNTYEQLGRDFTRGVSMKEFAKLCALKAVDEIIEATNMNQFALSNGRKHIPAKIVKHPFWIEVKQEIEAL